MHILTGAIIFQLKLCPVELRGQDNLRFRKGRKGVMSSKSYSNILIYAHLYMITPTSAS